MFSIFCTYGHIFMKVNEQKQSTMKKMKQNMMGLFGIKLSPFKKIHLLGKYIMYISYVFYSMYLWEYLYEKQRAETEYDDDEEETEYDEIIRH